MAEEKTTIEKVSATEMADLLSMGDAGNVMTEETQETILSRTKDVELTFGKEKKEEVVETPEEKKARLEKENTPDKLEEALNLKDKTDLEEDVEDKTDKNQLFSALEDLVKEEKFLLFEGDKPLQDYSKKELVEVFQANEDRIRKEEQEKAPAELFDALPAQLQYAVNYIANGGTDIQGLLKHLSQSEEVVNLDITTEKGQEQTVRQYLAATGYGTAEEIEEELTTLKDMPGALEKKATQFKPKLEAKQQQIIDKELKDQELRKQQHEKAAIKYREDIIEALKPDTLEGLKVTPTIKGMLFDGLTQSNYPSVSGRKTNLFGHLIEKYNYVEPNPKLIAEALWLLKDRKAYHEAIKASANSEMAGDIAKKLKSAGQEKTTSTNQESTHELPKRKVISKEKPNIFARP